MLNHLPFSIEKVAEAIFLAAYALLKLREVDHQDKALEMAIGAIKQAHKTKYGKEI